MAKAAPKVAIKRTNIDQQLILKCAELSHAEARRLVKLYHRERKDRRFLDNELKYLVGRGPNLEAIFRHYKTFHKSAENRVRNALDIWTDQHVPSRWIKTIPYMASYLAAEFYSRLDIRKCPHPYNWIRFCGQDPTVRWIWRWREVIPIMQEAEKRFVHPDNEDAIEWLARKSGRSYNSLINNARVTYEGRYKGQITWNSLARAFRKPPYVPALRRACFLTGRLFKVRSTRDPDHYYGQILIKRREYEEELNESGAYSHVAEEKLSRLPRENSIWKSGKLAPKHLDRKARRWATKLFLIHLHQVAYYEAYGIMPEKIPMLFALYGGKGPELLCPNWPFKN